MKPLVTPIPYHDPLMVFAAFADQPGSIWLDSARLQTGMGRYSFIGIDPWQIIDNKNGHPHADPFQHLQAELQRYQLDTVAKLPPCQGGALGFLSYDLCHHLENLPRQARDDMLFPDMWLGFYDLVISFDQQEKTAYICASGFPELEPRLQNTRAKQRTEALLKQLNQLNTPCATNTTEKVTIKHDLTQHEYEQAVQTVIDYILAGDIFEANFTQRFRADLPDNFDCFALYTQLRARNAAPFAAYINAGDTIIASASPERFLYLSNGHVETRPIKGTRPRSDNPRIDQALAEELLNSEKDQAENTMIVDLMRNDLSRVCQPGSIKVPQLCGLESFATVHHLVSAVTGQLKPGHDTVDLLRATFPGGSITGAPKIRAMEIIDELEPTVRGPYCGSIGYLGFNGNMDTSIVIRTYAIKDNKITWQAGGAVVADSEPREEYEESLAKANALTQTLTTT